MKETLIWCLTEVNKEMVPVMGGINGYVFTQHYFEHISDVLYWVYIKRYKKITIDMNDDSYAIITCERSDKATQYYKLNQQCVVSWHNDEKGTAVS